MITTEFLWYVLAGFAAQLVDGSLGMAYGVTASTLLLGLGVPPAATSATVHAAECLTTGASAISHHAFGNVNRVLFRRLLIPGIIGAVLGAYILTSIPGDALKPYIAGYLLIMGCVIVLKAFREFPPPHRHHTSCPARVLRRLPRCVRRWWLGAYCGNQSDCPRERSSGDCWQCECCGILCDPRGIDYVHSQSWPQPLVNHFRPRRRRRLGRSTWGMGLQAHPGQTIHDPHRHSSHGSEPQNDPQVLWSGLTWRWSGRATQRRAAQLRRSA
jgi:Sulfite exporter TauE/SafE